MAKRLNYQIGFSADAAQLQQVINQAIGSLQSVSSLRVGEGITADIKDAALAAQSLEKHLTDAVNVNTGNLDLSKFQASLNASGMTLADYANKLQAIGPIGEQAFLNVASAVAKAELPLTRSSKLLDSLWITMKNTMRWQLTSSALHGFMGTMQTAYGYAQDLNESLNNIRIVTNKSAEEMGDFAAQANKAAQALNTTTTDYTDASLIYYQQGLNDQEVEERTSATIKFANVSRQSAEVASEQLTSIWNNFYDGTKSLEYYIDVMVKLGAATASSSEEISQGVQKFAATADTIGLSYEYAAAALATVTATTRQSADVVGTAFKTLFARIQDLELGETLDDGTTLGTYSQALESVGINIKDANGGLKDMDIILDELGSKWNSISNDQQVALAQQVAGVRQYTQLMALMENWDFFQENLATAYGSEGELTRQADIYADSWEAARDRVTAAAENIYDSLINEEFFIGFDNDLASFLNGVASGVDAIGGMKGAVNLLGFALTGAFGDKIAQSLRDLTYNFTVMTGAAEKAQRQLKEEMGGRALAMVTDSGALSSDANITRAQIQAEDIQMQNQLNVVAKQLTEEQYKQLSGYKDIITQIKTMALEYDEVIAQQQESNDAIIQTISNLDNVSKSSIGYYNGLKKAGTELQQMPELLKLITNSSGKYSSSLNSLIQGYSKLGTVGSQLSTIRNQFQSIDEEVADNQVHIQQLSQRFQQLSGVQLKGNYIEQLAQMEKIVNQVNTAIEQLYNSLRASGIDTTILDNFVQTTSSIGANMENSTNATSIAAEETKRYMLAVYEATNQQKDWASMLVTGANELTRVAMMIQAVKNLGSIWNDEDLTTGEKVIQTMTSLGMIIPTVTSLIKLATASKTKYNAVTLTGTGIDEADILAKNAQTIAVGKHTKAKIIETKVVDGNTVSVVANTTAWYANPVFWIAAIIAGAVAAFTAYNNAIEENTKRLRENAIAEAEAAREQADASKQERETADALYKEYIGLRNSLDNSTEAKEALKAKTKELCEALGVEWSALDQLSEKYDEVNKEIAIANKQAVIDAISDTNRAIDRSRTSMLEEGSEYQGKQPEGYEKLTYRIEFAGGFNGADESDIKDYFANALSSAGFSGITTAGANTGLQLGMEDVDDFFVAYETLAQAVNDIQENTDFEGIRVESEVFQAAKSWIAEYADDYDRIVEYQKELVTYAQQLAEAEAAIAGYDLANVNSLDEYNEVKEQYIENLKNTFDDYDLLTPEMDDAYFEQLAEQYLAGYAHMADEILADNALEEILAIVGESNRETIKRYLEDNKYDIEILASLDWEVIGNSEDLESAIEAAYEAEEARRNAADFTVTLPATVGVIETLSEENELTEEQIDLLESLEEKYAGLAAIRDRSSAQYIQALRDIREGMEHSLSTDAVNKLNDAWNKLSSVVEDVSDDNLDGILEDVTGSYKVLRDLLGEEADIHINLDSDDAMQELKAIMDADYAVQLAIEADLQSDIDDFLTYSNDIQTALGYIEEGFTVSAENARALQRVFPGILAGYTVLANGMIQLDYDIAQQHINGAETQIAAEKEACKQNILDYQKVLLSKAAAMRTIAEGLWELSQSDTDSSEQAAEAKAKIENGVTQLKDACADEQALISEGLATSEIDDSNQILSANENAAGTSANNWADAYDSMARNSAEWARIAIANANKVGQALKNAESGGPAVSTDVATGGIFSHYSGGFEEAEYASTYESADAEEKTWEDFYEAGDYSGAYEAAIKQAEAWELAASNLTGYLAELDGSVGTIENKVDNAGKDMSGGDKEGTQYDAEDEKQLKDIEDRYHEITREIQYQESVLEDLDNQIDRTYGTKRLDLYKKSIAELTKQAANQAEKLREAQEDYLPQDTQVVIDAFGIDMVTFKENGEIANYAELLRLTVDEYNNTFLAQYNAFLQEYSALTKEEQEARKAEYESWQTMKAAADATFERRQAVLKQYEETLDVIQEMKDAHEETMRAIEDEKLNEITYKMEIVLDVKEAKEAAKEFSKAIVESFGDALTHGLGSAVLSADQAKLEQGLYSDYLEEYNALKQRMAEANEYTDTTAIVEEMKNLQSNIIGSGESLLEWVETIETMVPDAIDAARERFSLFTDQLEHNSAVLDTIKELLALQGVTYKTEKGFNTLLKATQEQMDASLANAELNKTWFERARTELLEAEAKLAGVEETDVAYDTLKNNRDALLVEYNTAQEAMLTSAQEAMEYAREMFETEIEKATYDFSQALSGGMGLDLLQDKYDHFIEEEERYLDAVNEAYEVSSWYNKLQADIDKTTNNAYKERLKELQAEIDIRREGNTLSEYDLNILEAKYQVLQAQMALEDAQNAKNELRLVRDSQGNWNYQYTADPEQIATAEQELLDAQNEYYNIAKEQVKEVTGEIIATWQECNDAIKEIYLDETLTVEEREAAIAEIRRYYNQKILDLEKEKNIALEDMTIAGGETIEKYGNTYDTVLGLMETDASDFESAFEKALQDAEGAMNTYTNNIGAAAETTGTTYEDLGATIDTVSESTENCRDAGIDAANAMWDTIDAVQNASWSYLELAQSIMETVYALQQLASAQATEIESYANNSTGSIAEDLPEVTVPEEPVETPEPAETPAPQTPTTTTSSSVSHGEMVQLVYDMGQGDYNNNPLRKEIVEGKYPGLYSTAQSILNDAIAQDRWNYDHNGNAWRQTIDDLVSDYGFASGGYTGDFQDAKLAFLHEKELVLNQKDTANILAAVSAVRAIGPELFAQIEKMLDSSAGAGAALMAEKLISNAPVAVDNGTIEQLVRIEHVEFPNVTSADEINDAFATLVNDAAQWARRRTE